MNPLQAWCENPSHLAPYSSEHLPADLETTSSRSSEVPCTSRSSVSVCDGTIETHFNPREWSKYFPQNQESYERTSQAEVLNEESTGSPPALLVSTEVGSSKDARSLINRQRHPSPAEQSVHILFREYMKLARENPVQSDYPNSTLDRLFLELCSPLLWDLLFPRALGLFLSKHFRNLAIIFVPLWLWCARKLLSSSYPVAGFMWIMIGIFLACITYSKQSQCQGVITASLLVCTQEYGDEQAVENGHKCSQSAELQVKSSARETDDSPAACITQSVCTSEIVAKDVVQEPITFACLDCPSTSSHFPEGVYPASSAISGCSTSVTELEDAVNSLMRTIHGEHIDKLESRQILLEAHVLRLCTLVGIVFPPSALNSLSELGHVVHKLKTEVGIA